REFALKEGAEFVAVGGGEGGGGDDGERVGGHVEDEVVAEFAEAVVGVPVEIGDAGGGLDVDDALVEGDGDVVVKFACAAVGATPDPAAQEYDEREAAAKGDDGERERVREA